MCFGGIEEPPFLPQLKKDVRVQEEDGGVVQDGTIGCKPGGGWDQRGRVVLTYILVIVRGIKTENKNINVKNKIQRILNSDNKIKIKINKDKIKLLR
jgi:hypothetical protein